MLGARSLLPIFNLLIALASPRAAAAEADARTVSGDAVIRAPFRGSEIVITTTSRVAGAIHSVTWNGKEFIDSADHGRQLQSASTFDSTATAPPETFNPTEAGSVRDGAGPRSTSRLLEISASGSELRTRTQMAFWLTPADRSAGVLARNTTALSNHMLAKQVRIGIPGLPNVLDCTVTFTLPAGEPHTAAQFEALTGYMPAEFSQFRHFNRATKKLEPLTDGPGEQRDPIAFSTPDGAHAMGIVAAEPTPGGSVGPGYGRFRFAAEKVVKWNCVYRERPADGAVKAGDYRYRMFVPIGTLADVEAALAKLATPL
jgi:hypothetical protein